MEATFQRALQTAKASSGWCAPCSDYWGLSKGFLAIPLLLLFLQAQPA